MGSASFPRTSTERKDKVVQHSRSIHLVYIPDVLLQVLPDLGELATRSPDHVELADDPASSEVEADETDDSDLLVGLRTA